MKKFFAEHVTQKKMTGEIVQRALQHYINEFDPYHVYLLASDVEPFLTMSNSELNRLADACEAQDYSIFQKLNDTIQEAIRKLLLFRRTMVVDINTFQELAVKPLPIITEDKRASVSSFAKNEVELDKLHAIYMAHLVGKELETYKSLNRSLSFAEAVRNVELELEEYENSYLYLNKEGKPLTAPQKEEAFALHILKALTASLDVHSEYFNTKEAENLRMKLQKEYEGVGISVEAGGSTFLVSSLVKGSSAEQSGKITVGDELTSIGQTKTKTLTLQEVEAALAGKEGTYVDLGFLKNNKDPYHVVLERRQITIQEGRVDTTFEKVPGGVIGVIQLHSFYQGANDVTSEQDVLTALKTLAKNGPIKGLVLDIRDNRGGFLLQAVKVAGLFIKSGVIVAAKYSDGSLRYFRDTDSSVAYTGPLIILTSRETASAAEIVAEALKDYGVAIIVGDAQTYGKGSIQTQTVTGDKESESYFKVTIGRYYSVSGVSTQLEGVKSDIVLPSYRTDKNVGEAYLTETINADRIDPSFADTLSDVPQEEKTWYEHYYLPFLQQKNDFYRRWIPELARKSRLRLEKDQNYQNLIHGDFTITEKHGLTVQKIVLDQKSALRTLQSMQLQEAINITKDLIEDLSGSQN
ncbi:MAG: PDZ domain-containing protein [Chlamydiales bacterium]|nr:PDZ domain-containing protein [Chlamydiales bacterium]